LTSDGSAVAMMCGRDEEPNQMEQLTEKSLWLAHVAKLWTHTIDNKKQASKGLKKIIDNMR
jgi:hypothetical protein